MKQAPLIVVIYDGIDNSVFESQVVQPLSVLLEQEHDKEVLMVSFEKNHPSHIKLLSKIKKHPRLTLVIRKKIPFMGRFSLMYAVHALKKMLKSYASYHLLARGPFAGYLCQQAVQPDACKSLTIQVRGLMACEYWYEKSLTMRWFTYVWHALRYYQFFNLETLVYNHKATSTPFQSTLQTVSQALSEYIITTYDAQRDIINVASHDIPTAIDKEQLRIWKKDIRKELDIPDDAKVYCYNGSSKSWQCPEKVIAYFKDQHSKHPSSLLYVLTQDTHTFEKLFKKHVLEKDSFRLLCVPHADMYRYLAAADIGMMFREPHIVNWVSRPTKALEYKAAGLEIAHNNTVSWLVNNT